MTAYVVSGMGRPRMSATNRERPPQERPRLAPIHARCASRYDPRPARLHRLFPWPPPAAHPKMSSTKPGTIEKLSDEGLALAGLALDAAGDSRAKDAAATYSKRKPKPAGAMLHWAGNYDGLLDYWDDTSPETTAFALKLLVRQDRSSGLLPKAAVVGSASIATATTGTQPSRLLW
jgi:hypothetical protein